MDTDKLVNLSFPKVSIIIINWNNYNDSKECLRSLAELTYKNIEIIVVDNNSTDGSVQKLLNEQVGYTVIRNSENLGFAAGNNVGIRKAIANNTDYVLILNNDTIVKNDCLEPMVSFLEKNIKVGIVGGKIYFHSNPEVIWTIGGDVKLMRGGSVYYGNNEKDIGQYNEIKELTHISGCMSLIRKEVLKDVGLLSEQYFFRGEEWDFCYRVKKAGYKLYYIPEAIIWHKVSQTVDRFSPFDIYTAYRAKLIFINNFMPRPFNYIWISLFYMYARIYSVNKFKKMAKKRFNKNLNEEMYKKIISLVFTDNKNSNKITLADKNKIDEIRNEYIV